MDTEINEPHISQRGAKIVKVGMTYDGAEIIAFHTDSFCSCTQVVEWSEKRAEKTGDVGLGGMTLSDSQCLVGDGTYIHLSDERFINIDDISWDVSYDNK